MKAVVLARGKGTRMQREEPGVGADGAQERVARTGFKGLIPFRRPFLDYVLSALADAGVSSVCLIVGPGANPIRDHYSRNPPVRLRLTYAVQEEASGTAHAVLAARAFAGSDGFLVMNADNYYPPDVLRALVALDGPGLPAFRRSALLENSNIDAGRIESYAVLRIDSGGILLDIIEKPDAGTLRGFGSDFFVSMNCWRFDTTIFEACSAIVPSARGEFELPEAVRYAVRTLHVRFRAFPVDAGVLDLSYRSDIAAVGRRLAHLTPRP